MSLPSTLQRLIEALPDLYVFHGPTTRVYALLKMVARAEVERRFAPGRSGPQDFAPFGELVFSYQRMGAVDSLDLFGLDELIIFSFYWTNRTRYRRVVDIGSNIGLHSILLNRCGFEVRSFEPDPIHFELLQRNLAANDCTSVMPIDAAVSSEDGTMEFVRVLGNTTGSHLARSKPSPYGKLQRFPVNVESFASLVGWADLVKLDAEGHEKTILLATTREQWEATDALVEVGSYENAGAIFEHFGRIKVNLFAQKINWQRIRRLEDMPISYRDGSLFISCKPAMPWSS